MSAAAPSGTTLRGFAKIRRGHAPQAAEAAFDGDADDGTRGVRVRFRSPVRAPAPGQALVLYDDEGFVLGGGWIRAARR